MGLTRIDLPRLGETMEEARVVGWLVAPGAAFARGETLLEVETDKTVVEVPALMAGVMRAHLVAEGETVAIGQPIAEVETEDDTPAAAPRAVAVAAAAAAEHAEAAAPVPETARPVAKPAEGRVAASPRARSLARAAGLDLAGLHGTGRRGRVTGGDVAAALRDGPGAGGARPRHGGIAFDRLGASAGAGSVLMLHGLFASAAGFGGLPGRLAGAGARVLVPDLPGHGDSPGQPGGLGSIEAALVGLVAAEAPDGPVRILGHSMGAILAVRLARRLGPRAARLVLVAPAGLGLRLSADFLDVMLGAETPAALRRGLLMLGAGPVSEALAATELARLAPHRAAQRALAAEIAPGGLQQIDLAAELAGLAVPVAAVFGTADTVVPWQDCAALSAEVAIHLVAGAGHMPHLPAEALVARLLLGTA